MSAHPRCPVDASTLEAHVHGALAFHGCPRCHGLWFTVGAMDATRHGPVPADPFAARTDSPASTSRARPDGGAKGRRCPGCAGKMRTRDVDGVEVDTCPACRSVWLDAGEFDSVVAWQRLRERSVTAHGPDGAKVAKVVAATAAVGAVAVAAQEEPSRASRLEAAADVAGGVVDVAGEGWLVVEMVGDLAGFLGNVVVDGGGLALEAAGAVLSLVGGLLDGL